MYIFIPYWYEIHQNYELDFMHALCICLCIYLCVYLCIYLCIYLDFSHLMRHLILDILDIFSICALYLYCRWALSTSTTLQLILTFSYCIIPLSYSIIHSACRLLMSIICLQHRPNSLLTVLLIYYSLLSFLLFYYSITHLSFHYSVTPVISSEHNWTILTLKLDRSVC
jgi:hypothetical protein